MALSLLTKRFLSKAVDLTQPGTRTKWVSDLIDYLNSSVDGVNTLVDYLNTPTSVSASLSVFTSTAKGAVPASGGGTTNFLRADAVFAAPPIPPTPNIGSYSDVTGSRVLGTTYTNSTGKNLYVIVILENTNTTTPDISSISVGGATVGQLYTPIKGTLNVFVTFSFVVPNGKTYNVSAGVNGVLILTTWNEAS